MIKRLLTITLFFAFSVATKAQSDYEKQLSYFSNDLAAKIKKSHKLKIAVSDFLDNNQIQTELGKSIAEELSVGLINANSDSFQVMERSNLTAILTEHKLASTGLIDPETAKKLGKLKAVDAVIVGTITPLINSFRITIKVLDTETGLAFAATNASIASTPEIKELFSKKVNAPTQITTQQENKETPKQNATSTDNEFGTIEFENQTDRSLALLLGVEIVEPMNYGKKYEQLTVNAMSTDKLEGIRPGTYYVCITNTQRGYDCYYTKTIIVRAGQTNKIKYKF